MKQNYVLMLGGKILEEFNKIKPMLKSTNLFTASDVARLCKLSSNATFFVQSLKNSKNLTLEEKQVKQEVANINEWIDALLTERVPFQAIRPPEQEL